MLFDKEWLCERFSLQTAGLTENNRLWCVSFLEAPEIVLLSSVFLELKSESIEIRSNSKLVWILLAGMLLRANELSLLLIVCYVQDGGRRNLE